MEWDNCFSYGNNNYINFDEEPLRQLVGVNGSGKTSISLILQEVLYGKNIKGIKKQDIANNKTDTKGYRISLTFEKDGSEYKIDLDRKSGLKLKFYKDGDDISSHTSANTYKTIASIIGIDDFKVFCQLIYQHSTDSLDFLTATDANRKKFLINLLQLEKYIEYYEIFKDAAKDANNDLTVVSTRYHTVQEWVKEHEKIDLTKMEPREEIDIDHSIVVRIDKLKDQIANINRINAQINTNNNYKQQLASLKEELYLHAAPDPQFRPVQELHASISIKRSEISKLKDQIAKQKKITSGECPTCLQPVDQELKDKIIADYQKQISALEDDLLPLEKEYKLSREEQQKIKAHKEETAEFERLSSLVVSTLDSKTLDINELKSELSNLEKKLAKQKRDQKEAQDYNVKVAAHNSKVDVVKEQLEETRVKLSQHKEEMLHSKDHVQLIELLKKTFGTNGLVSYKIESSVKELEKKINQYLIELTHYQIFFKLNGDKLNIEVVDDLGNQTNMSNLSSGERARVNIATILAIRSILSTLTSTKINLLFLDEVIGVIDAEGKEKLADLLLQEQLNTLIVSHDWTHPLISRIDVVKEKNISRIDYGD